MSDRLYPRVKICIVLKDTDGEDKARHKVKKMENGEEIGSVVKEGKNIFAAWGISFISF